MADEYLEHDLTVVIIDLILAKPQAYRHLLFNRASLFSPPVPHSASGSAAQNGAKTGLATRQNGGGGWRREVWTVAKQFLALSLVDAYIRWFYLCVQPPLPPPGFHQLDMDGASRLSARLWQVVQQHLPMQAGIFFPSLFTPRASNTDPSLWETEDPIRAVCSTTPIWSSTATPSAQVDERADKMIPTLVSYVNVLVVTLIEGIALHICVGVLTWITVQRLTAKYQRERSTSTSPAPRASATTASVSPIETLAIITAHTLPNADPNTSNPLHNQTTCPYASTSTSTSLYPTQHARSSSYPLLACKALLLSQLSPLILLTFLLLWSSNFSHPHPHPSPSASPHTSDRHWMVWLIRTFLASLNAGVAIATILPPTPPRPTKTNTPPRTKHALALPPLILGSAWILQALTSLLLYSYLS